ncbi:MAG: hypothetical protein DME86_06725 [Verrucomicrobia bacterium]|nr:MAG: hypothetical protein DME86_06725 [Verrucomicrobiota bacterium]PYK71785.1 MAG: hypothetical protein DME42_10180 [Verrucomicrobiota bacterium]
MRLPTTQIASVRILIIDSKIGARSRDEEYSGVPKLAAVLRLADGEIRSSASIKRRSDSERESVSERSQAKITSCLFFSPRSPARSRLLIYFEGSRLTRASTAGYFEMMQTLAAVCIT